MLAPEPLTRGIAAALSAAAVVWAVSLPLAPHARGVDEGTAGRGALAAIPYVAGALVCHQRTDRSFASHRGVPWPVCARCAGLYLAAGAGSVAALLFPRRMVAALGRSRLWRPALLWAAAPTAASWLVERAGWWMPDASARAWLAVPLGAAVGALVALAARGALTDRPKT